MSLDLVVVGLGYVGLPLAVRAAEAGLATAGLDISDAVVEGLNAGRSHVGDVSREAVAELLASGFRAGTDPAVIGTADTVVICVPTGLSDDGEPDLAAVRSAACAVADHLRPGMLVVLESTSYPGTTEETVLPLLEERSGLAVGSDFHLVFSPERIDPGNAAFGVRNTPKVVGGVTPLCAKYGATFYGRFVDSVVVARGTREAELAKLLENTYRYVNIALVNEVSQFCDQVNIDVWDVLRCAGTKPFGYVPFDPGPGVGGHCIPIDPLYLASKAREEGFTFDVLSAAREVNDRMPRHIVDRAEELLREKPIRGSRVLLLGVTYKRDVADTRESPAFPVARELCERGAEVLFHDPHVKSFTVDGAPMAKVDDVESAFASADLAILLQAHAEYNTGMLSRAACPLLDTRGVIAGEQAARM
ncbi:nucleotide sugar dehydrogenase [Saccharopolyspora antimicrobica]|uniref:Nucleotide sugar dehydrogenase n=1 Tax=Saccharopolyspora antimicrobica TaxID=455193 RepID=A0A1I5M1W5_9PSEU|nr:nucleotide sugar dehydrogenase [Saccharopolyspora antimicrobica]RKT89229.1 nucleotide sugar dehydrogenase [Saccharopolyspora antimicrobica]SFP03031.1 nucleotide sugar dehydrogenase [Saccharopolyspora antimicrobica]